jgi:alpha-glucosidase
MDYLWWQTGVIYQIYPRSFKDTSGNGIGDLQGILGKLDYLANTLGVNAIWISPFYPSPMKDFGYDVADYCNVDPIFGDLATFDNLLAQAHERGIKIIIDWVPNHTSDEHPWFIESRGSQDNPKRDWYIWRDPQPDGSPPNNWGSFFGGPAWTFDERTGQYYMHQFVSEQPELNWRNPEVETAMFNTLRFWLDRGVDGFRMDVIGLIIKDKQLRDNPSDPNAPAGLPENDLFGRLLQVYNLDQKDIHSVLREIRQVFDDYKERVAIGELWGPLERWVKYYGDQGDELHLPFNFRLMNQPWQAAAMRQSVNEMEAVLPEFAWPNYVLGNHDIPRLASRFGGHAQARVAAMMLLTLRGTPTIYYGDELGLENGLIPPEKIQDPQGINLGVERTRDVCRTPMQWDASQFAGFSPAEPWLPVSSDFTTRNVETMQADPKSILTLYRRLLSLRSSSPALQIGSYTAVSSLLEQCFIYQRATQDERILITLNFSGENQVIRQVVSGRATLLLSTHLDRMGAIEISELTLRPHEGLVIQLIDVD